MSAAEVLALCRERSWMLATAESCTGGMVAAALTDVPGSSDVVERGYVTYSNRAKVEMLGVRPVTLDRFGAVSEETAREMAAGALQRSGTDIAVAITGVAGPGGTPAKPEGLVCFGLAVRGATIRTEQVSYGALGRATVRARATAHALWLLAEAARG